MSKRRFTIIEENEKVEFVGMEQDSGTTQQETWLIN